MSSIYLEFHHHLCIADDDDHHHQHDDHHDHEDNDDDEDEDDRDIVFDNPLDKLDDCDDVLDVKFQGHLGGWISLEAWLG